MNGELPLEEQQYPNVENMNQVLAFEYNGNVYESSAVGAVRMWKNYLHGKEAQKVRRRFDAPRVYPERELIEALTEGEYAEMASTYKVTDFDQQQIRDFWDFLDFANDVFNLIDKLESDPDERMELIRDLCDEDQGLVQLASGIDVTVFVLKIYFDSFVKCLKIKIGDFEKRIARLKLKLRVRLFLPDFIDSRYGQNQDNLRLLDEMIDDNRDFGNEMLRYAGGFSHGPRAKDSDVLEYAYLMVRLKNFEARVGAVLDAI